MHLRYPQTAKSRRRRYRFFLLRQNNPYANAETSAWVTRVVAAGSTVSPASATAHDTFITSLKSAGVWSQISRLNTFGASSLAGALVPLVNTSGSPTDTNHNFVSTNFTLATGLTGDGATKYLDTGAIPSLVPASGGHLMAIAGTIGGSSYGALIGESPNPPQTQIYQNPGNNNIVAYYAGNGNVNTTTSGMLMVSALNTNTVLYRNATSKVTATGTFPTSAGAGTVFVYFLYGGSFYYSGPLQGYSLGLNLTQVQATSYYNALNTLMSALGRAIPV